ncbi:peptidase T [Aggregatimonas sangjinii]|uniref:Peptidase T n=1 Tax=Aggregatimonas sangjinii TaxID=2583587 RepID=A0A5B7SRE3_9FLAO|nr:peptidase T [Aggregatimonas sangjinii]QCX00802.1 peptidase T [Aggregatimonas sangjinii]
MQQIIDRFISYVKIDTQSDPNSDTTPSTEKQWHLADLLVDELIRIGMEDVTVDDNAYIMATLPSNLDFEVPVIGFISHFDTSPDFSGTGVNPQVINDYDGGDIVLNVEEKIVLSPYYFDDLLHYKGQTLITTDGTTLLGADDKAGITEIITAMEYLVQHPEIKHGKIRVGFTPDEEIGRGAHKFDVEKFGADWAYTMDGSQVGELEYENFNAASAKVTIKGKSVHPGYAMGKMVNAISIANEFMWILPIEETPQNTTNRDGFFHIHHMQGTIEHAEFELIVRDHDRLHFEKRKQLLLDITEKLNALYNDCVQIKLKDQYYNMREKVEPVMHIVDLAKEAMQAVGVKPIIKPIRGGTDGSQLSFMGLPCPNIFAGGHNFHGKYEYVPVESMQKAVAVIVKICELLAEKSEGKT